MKSGLAGPEEIPLKELLQGIEIMHGGTPQYSVIWLHGLGADGSDFVPVVPELGLAEAPGVRFIFPNAPEIPVTCNGGYVMPAWYDIISLESTSRKIDETGIVHSRAAIRQLIARENERGIPCNRIFLAGFSQGGAVAYTTALTHPEPLAGLFALSTYLPTVDLVAREATEVNHAIPILAIHGSLDDVVSPTLGRQAKDLLLAKGYDVTWQEYPMPHTLCLEEVQLIGEWLQGLLK